MTWIGRDCDVDLGAAWSLLGYRNQNLWPELEGIVTIFVSLTSSSSLIIRIYDLNWKGLWHCLGGREKRPVGISEFMTWIGRDCDIITSATSTSAAIYQNLWPELERIVTQHGRRISFSPFLDQNLWPELEGIVTEGTAHSLQQGLLDQNLWPELEGIVTAYPEF